MIVFWLVEGFEAHMVSWATLPANKYTIYFELHNEEQLDQTEVQHTMCVYKTSTNQKNYHQLRLETN